MGLIELKKERYFLHLLFTTSKNQVQALFYTLTPQQAKALCEIIYNLNKLPVPPTTTHLLLMQRKLIKQLTDKKLSLNRKLHLLQNHYRQVYEVLLSVDKKILRLLS